uniref:Small ribosomal subunit protein uS13 n=1 Tax=uncultured korarchaeote TaxID=161241 RepID=A0A1L2JK02_9CREN|nr:ribosomal protein S13 [uncultured korarchaeote]
MAEGGEKLKHIVRMFDTDLEGHKAVLFALTKLPGVSYSFSNAVVRILGLDPLKPLGFLSSEDIKKIEDVLKSPDKYGIPSWLYNRRRDPITGEDKHIVGSRVKLVEKMDIDRLKKMRCWRGIRHMLGLKVRGQRTRTTGRRGRTVGYSKKKK